jgi:hypothetical protein
MPSLVLGNTAPIEAIKVDEGSDEVVRHPRPDLGNTTTVFSPAEHLGLGQILTLVSSVYASHHSDDPPAWVESDDPGLADALAREFDCPVGRPDDWVEGVPAVDEDAKPDPNPFPVTTPDLDD